MCHIIHILGYLYCQICQFCIFGSINLNLGRCFAYIWYNWLMFRYILGSFSHIIHICYCLCLRKNLVRRFVHIYLFIEINFLYKLCIGCLLFQCILGKKYDRAFYLFFVNVKNNELFIFLLRRCNFENFRRILKDIFVYK